MVQVTLIAKQNRFLAYAFGATSFYHGKDIVMGHAHLIINQGRDAVAVCCGSSHATSTALDGLLAGPSPRALPSCVTPLNARCHNAASSTPCRPQLDAF